MKKLLITMILAAVLAASAVAVAQTNQRFDDVPSEHYHFDAIEWMADTGITGGCLGGSSFCPDVPVTRAQMALFLQRYYKNIVNPLEERINELESMNESSVIHPIEVTYRGSDLVAVDPSYEAHEYHSSTALQWSSPADNVDAWHIHVMAPGTRSDGSHIHRTPPPPPLYRLTTGGNVMFHGQVPMIRCWRWEEVEESQRSWYPAQVLVTIRGYNEDDNGGLVKVAEVVRHALPLTPCEEKDWAVSP